MSEHKLANPAPMAVTAFATTSFMLGVFNAGLLPHGGMPLVLDLALIFGGLVQIIGGVLEFCAGNTFTTAVFCTYGPFWIAFAAFELWFAKMIPPADIPSTVALFLGTFAIVTIYFLIASFKTDWVLIIIVTLIELTLVSMTIGAAYGIPSLDVLGGWMTIIFAVLAWYHAAAGIISYTWGREVLPLWPVKKSEVGKLAGSVA